MKAGAAIDDGKSQDGSLPAICHVVPYLDTGGMERIVESMLTEFTRRGHKMCLFCTDREGDLFATACAVAKVCGDRRRRPLTIDWRVVGSLKRFIRENGVGILHAHNFLAQMHSVLAAIGSDAKVVTTIHGQTYFLTKRLHYLQKLLAWRTFRIVCVSEDVSKTAVGRRCCRPAKLAVIRNGIRCDHLQQRPDVQVSSVRQRLGIPAGAFVAGSVGRFAVVKNYPLLVKAFARMMKNSMFQQSAVHSPKPTLLIVGDGPDRPDIERTIAECGIADSVVLPGMQVDVEPWLAAMDVFCLSSLTEGTSISLLEAGAAGLPAVVTDVGGNSEVIEAGITGFLVPDADE
ncbi:MAG: glycosyltransferase, partial [bacterium]